MIATSDNSQIVSLEVCKVMKELKVPLLEHPMGHITKYREPSNGTIRSHGMRGSNPDRLLYAPKQADLQKWLRNKLDVHVSAYPICRNRYLYTVTSIETVKTIKVFGPPYEPWVAKDTYEEALNEALILALKYAYNVK